MTPEARKRAPGKVFLVGAGPGDPGLLTIRGLELLRDAEVVIYDRLVGEDVLAEAPDGAERIYVGKEAGSHTIPQDRINALLVAKASEGRRVVRLKGGDPFVFGRGGEEAEALAQAGIPFEVVPGVTSAVAVPAYAGIPLTHRGVATSFAVVTGREDPAKPETQVNWDGLATGADTIVCLMGVKQLPHVVEQLLRHGRPAGTPIALIRWGTWPSQETLSGTLGDIVEQVAVHNFGPPAVAVIGEVVRLRERFRWLQERPLFGRRVLVTRSREQAGVLSAVLRGAGAVPVEVPLIGIAPPANWELVDQAISCLHEYSWAVFTSANGVRSFFGRLAALGRDARVLGPCRVAAIGPATAGALRESGIRADLVPAEFVAEALLAELAKAGVGGERVLLARAEVTRDVLEGGLRELGARVDLVTLYRTTRVEDAPARLASVLARGLDAITLASSSSVRHLVEALGQDAGRKLDGVAVACIGPVTAQTARDLGLRVDVEAVEYTMNGLVEALENYFRGRPRSGLSG